MTKETSPCDHPLLAVSSKAHGRCADCDYATEFARRLAVKQPALDEPFSTILHANLWDLYVRS